jgi:hypothetical protein
MSPTSNRPYQDAYRKDSKTQDIFRKRKDMVLEKDITERNREQVILWTTFWRRNIHRFIIDVMEINLFPFQIIWIYLMQISPLFVSICSRTASKSFLLGVFCTARSILYPGLQTIIAATTKDQAGRIISKKITWLQNNSPLCKAEIKNLVENNNKYECVFHNGSVITVVAANEGALGNRCNDLVIDEYAKVDKTVVDEILKPFLFPRQVIFTQNPEYADYIEPIRIYYISSAWYANDWWYKTALFVIKQMAEGKDAGFFATDYLSSIKHKLKTVQQMEDEKKDNASFDMQYGNIPGKVNENSYYQAGMFKRTINKAFYPMRKMDIPLKKNPFGIPKSDSEIRILGIDCATRKSKTNDNSVISCIILRPSKIGYERRLVYMENSHGKDHIAQANRIKDVWHDFQADFIALDVANIGIDIFVDLSLPYFNEERGIQMPAFTVMNIPEIDQKTREELLEKTYGINALPIIFPVSGTLALNSEMHVAFRSALQKKLWSFLVSEVDGEDFLVKNVKEIFNQQDEGIKSYLLHPYVQVSLFINEALNLEMQIVNSNIKLTESSGARKDRYMAVVMANHLASIFDKKLLRQEDDTDDWATIESMTFIL